MLQVAAALSVTSAITLLLGLMNLAVATAMASVVLLCVVAISFVTTMLLAVWWARGGRAAYWFPPPG